MQLLLIKRRLFFIVSNSNHMLSSKYKLFRWCKE
nr:MAG TPA: hypothetical protein [Caudoviricetes sp.]